ncbi:MAG: AAA family ATPase, partial [Proteobacteria bacterium]|nr:AAA family ATPase [Pseudomonadota bacterium]
MINWLDVRDFVVVKKTQVSFESGMTVITGETGAGKSVLVDALSILLGGRASTDLIRYGSDYAEIQADFDIQTLPQARDWLRNMELTADAGECTLRRLIYREKSSRGFINGKPVPIQSLRDLGKLLADIHGQHEHHRLLQREVQRFLLDSDAGILDEVKQLGEISTKAQQLETRLNDS